MEVRLAVIGRQVQKLHYVRVAKYLSGTRVHFSQRC